MYGLRVRLFPVTPEPVKPVPRVNLSGAERAKKWRNKLKNNPENHDAYVEHKKIDALRSKIYRLKEIDDDAKNKHNEGARYRMREYRARLKLKGRADAAATSMQVEGKAKIRTRADDAKAEQRRIYWKLKKAEQRARMSSQKKRRVNEKRKEEYDRKRTKQLAVADSMSQFNDGNEGFVTAAATRQAIARAKGGIPKTASKFASVIGGIVNSATPRKRKALVEKGFVIVSPKTSRQLQFSQNIIDLCHSLKAKCDSASRLKRKYLMQGLLVAKKYREANLLAKQFKINPKYTRKCTRNEDKKTPRSDAMTSKELQSVNDFYLRSDVSAELSSKKTASSKTMVQKHILDKSIASVHEQYIQEHPNKNISLSKFSKLRPKNVLKVDQTPCNQCLCEYCANVELKLRSLNILANNRKCITAKVKDKYQCTRMTTCVKGSNAFNKWKCIERTCTVCGIAMLQQHYVVLMESSEDIVIWKRWENKKFDIDEKTVTKKVLVVKSGTIRLLVKELCDEIEPFALHLFHAKWQYSQFSKISKSMPRDWVVFVMDFAENYACAYQDEIQSAHWQYNQVTIHPIVVYYWCPICKDHIVQESLVFVSNDRVHDAHAVHHFVEMANNHLKIARKLEIKHEVQFTDGCSAQYKSKLPFCDISHSLEDFGFKSERSFFGSRHGKGPCDGCGGVVKNAVTRAVMSRKAIVSNAEELFEFCKQNLVNESKDGECCHSMRGFYFVDKSDIERNRGDRTAAKTLKGTRDIHCVKTTEAGVVGTRLLSCYCTSCTGTGSGTACENADYVDHWKEHVLIKSNSRVGSVSIANVPDNRLQPSCTSLPEQIQTTIESTSFTDLVSLTAIDPSYQSPMESTSFTDLEALTAADPLYQTTIESASFTDLESLIVTDPSYQTTIESTSFTDLVSLTVADPSYQTRIESTSSIYQKSLTASDPSNTTINQSSSDVVHDGQKMAAIVKPITVATGDFVGVKIHYDGQSEKVKLFLGEVLEEDQQEGLRVKFLKESKMRFYWPDLEDISWVPFEDIIVKMSKPSTVTKGSRGYLTFSISELKNANKLCEK